jgi:hypothetical protein
MDIAREVYIQDKSTYSLLEWCGRRDSTSHEYIMGEFRGLWKYASGSLSSRDSTEEAPDQTVGPILFRGQVNIISNHECDFEIRGDKTLSLGVLFGKTDVAIIRLPSYRGANEQCPIL